MRVPRELQRALPEGDRHDAQRMAPAEALTVMPGDGTLRSPRHRDLRQKSRGTIAAHCTDMRVSALAFTLSTLLVASTASAQDEPAPAPAEPTEAKPAEAPPPAEMPKAEVKTGGLRLGLDLSYARSTGEASDRVTAHSPGMIPLGADVSFRLSPRVLLGGHGHIGLASRDDCLGDSSCTARTYALGAHVEAAFVSHGFFVPWIRYGIGWEMLNQRGMYKNDDGYRYAHGLDLLDLRFGGDFRVSDATRIGPFVGMIAGLGLHEDRAPSAERSLNSGHVWFTIGARGNFEL